MLCSFYHSLGRTKLEPLAIVILSVVMALASVQMIRESIEKIIAFATEDADGPTFGVTSIVICSITIGIHSYYIVNSCTVILLLVKCLSLWFFAHNQVIVICLLQLPNLSCLWSVGKSRPQVLKPYHRITAMMSYQTLELLHVV